MPAAVWQKQVRYTQRHCLTLHICVSHSFKLSRLTSIYCLPGLMVNLLAGSQLCLRSWRGQSVSRDCQPTTGSRCFLPLGPRWCICPSRSSQRTWPCHSSLRCRSRLPLSGCNSRGTASASGSRPSCVLTGGLSLTQPALQHPAPAFVSEDVPLQLP